MNKLFTKIAALALGAAMVVGVGVAVGSKSVSSAEAAEQSLTPGTGEILYTHDFSTKPDASSDVTLACTKPTSPSQTSVVWTTSTATNLGSYNSGNYKGVQLGTSSKTGSITFTTKYDWGSVENSTYEGYTTVKKIAVFLNNGSGKINATVKVDNTTCSKTGSVSKNSSAVSQRDGTSKLEFTPATGHESGKIEIALSTSSKAGYFCSFQVICAEPEEEKTLTGLRIDGGTSSVNKLYEPNQSFDGTGLTVYASWDSAEDTSKNVVNNVVWNGGNALTAGLNQTITGYHSSDTNEDYPIQVTGVDVVNPDFTHTYSNNNVFASDNTSVDAENTKTHTPSSGPEYITLGGYNYNSSTMSINKVVGMYLANNTAYSKNIRRIVITVNNANIYSVVTMYEGATALQEGTVVTQKTSEDKLTLTYDFSDTKQFFKFKVTTAGTWVNMTSIKVFLGSAPVAKVVDTVSITGTADVYVGKTLQLTATVTYTGGVDPDNNVIWSVTSGSGATVSDSGLVTAIDSTATTIEAKSVEKNSQNVQVSASVTITPLANPITSVAWDTSNAKTAYYVGDELDISGISAVGTNAAGDTDVEITLTESNFSGFDTTTTGGKTVTVTYLTFSTTYSILVSEKPSGIVFGVAGTGSMKVESTDASGTDTNGYTWNVVSVFSGDTSFTNGLSGGSYRAQIGSGKKPCSSVTLSMDPGSIKTYTSFDATFAAFSGDSGDISLKLDNTEIASTSLNETTKVHLTIDQYYRGREITIEITNMTRVELYSIEYFSYSDDEMVTNFVNNWMHMDYDKDGTHGSTGGNGSCKSQGWYTAAKTNYGLLFDPQKSLFNTESKYDAAKQRLVDWATANEEVFDPAAYTFTPINARSIFSVIGESVTSGTSIIIIVSVIGVSALGGFFFLRKRKEI